MAAGGVVRTSCVVVAVALLTAAPAAAQPIFEPLCTPAVPGLEELSGMTVIGDTWYAMGDSGTDEQLAVLNSQCGLERWIPNPVDPFDTEDVTSHDGTLWLADIGDNARKRPTIALVRMNPADGAGELHRLTYPDAAHDAEALLIDGRGRPVIVTKQFSGVAGIYSTAGDLSVDQLPSPGPVALEKRGELARELITGGAVSADGRVAALRDYSNAYLYPVRDGDIVAALTTEQPVVVPIPQQPQGESIAFTASGDLIAGSESGGDTRPIPPLLVLRGAAGLVVPLEPVAAPGDSPGRSSMWWWAAGAVALAAVGSAVWRMSQRRRQ